jgi:hypothetical protein
MANETLKAYIVLEHARTNYMENYDIDVITKEEAIELLLGDTHLEVDSASGSESIFDAYGNYNYPFDAKIKEPNIASGYVFVETIPIN